MAKSFPRGASAFELTKDQMSPQQAEFTDRITAGPRGRVPINLRAWLHNIDFANVVEPFGLYVSETAPITKREKEIAVLVNARFWQAEFEWAMHERHARKAGIEEAAIAAIKEGRDPGFTDAGEALTYRLAHSLHELRRVPDDLYQHALDYFGHKGVSDRIGLMGLYTMIAFTLNFYGVEAPQDGPK